MLIAEQFVLLTLDPDGSPARTGTRPYVKVGVTGALVAELETAGHLALDEGRIHITGTAPPAHPLLAAVLAGMIAHEGKRVRSRLPRIERAGWSEVVDAMIEDGILGREEHALRPTRHPVLDPSRHAELLVQVRAAATGDGPLDDRMAVLLALAGPCHQLEVVAPERSGRGRAKRRIGEAGDRVPVAGAVKHVVDSLIAASSTAGAAGGGA